MKKFKLLFFALFGFLSMVAQDPDPRLFENIWYLTDLVVDGNTIDIPETSEVDDPSMYFLTDRITAIACNSIASDISDFTNTTFTVDTWNLLIFSCNLQSTLDFEGFYFEDFFRSGFPVGEIFTYTLESGPNDALTLTIVNADGDIGVFGNPALGVEDLESISFTLYPNPVSEMLFLRLSADGIAKEVIVYDVQGKLIHQEASDNNLIEIDTSKLNTGLYFVHILDHRGKTFVERVVKE